MPHLSPARSRRGGLLAAALCFAGLAASAPGATASSPGKVGAPDSMASTGDSITRAFHTGGLLQDVPGNSWSTGTSGTVNSHYSRILASHPAISGKNFNEARTGAQMDDFARQASNVVARGAEYVTVLLGANDACTSTEAGMTPVATYRNEFRAGMETLSRGLPNARIYVVSVPNIYRLWEIGRNNLGARFAWGLYGICQSMLANPGSTSATDEARRQRVRQRVVDFNTQLREVCAEYIHCRYDNNAAFNTQFVLSDMSTIDYFHPNVQGQAKAASVTWASTFDFADRTAPTTGIGFDRDADGAAGWYRGAVQVTLHSSDADLAGSEYYYRLRGAEGDTAWTRYTGPFTVDAEGITDVTYRSVDVNGNIEAAKTAELKIDRTAPQLSVACPQPTLLNGEAAATVTATDSGSGFEPTEDPNGAYRLATDVAGAHSHYVEVADLAGNRASATCTFEVHYAYGGISQPVNADGSSVFKLGSTVPLKFQLSDAAGALVDSAVATVAIRRDGSATDGQYEGTVSTASPTAGDRFRYSEDGSQYVFNLGTKSLAKGSYRAEITLDDGTTKAVTFALR